MISNNEHLARRLEGSEAAHWGSLMQGLPGSYGAQVMRFGRLTALSCPGMAKRSFVNRIFGLGDGDDDALTAAVDWMRSRGVPVRIDLCPMLGHELTLRGLAREGFRTLGFQVALFGEPHAAAPSAVEIREAVTEAEFAHAAAALPVVFDECDPTWVQWLTDSMWATFGRPDWRTYVAYVDGQAAGFGQLHLWEGVGSLALAGTLHQFRGRGVQTALIHRRMEDAAALGCDLIVAQTGNGTVSQQNMERLGLRVAYTKAEFYLSADQGAPQQA